MYTIDDFERMCLSAEGFAEKPLISSADQDCGDLLWVSWRRFGWRITASQEIAHILERDLSPKDWEKYCFDSQWSYCRMEYGGR